MFPRPLKTRLPKLVVLCVCFHHTKWSLAMILVNLFLSSANQHIRTQHTSFSAVQVHLIHLKLIEWQAISAVKFEIQLGVKEMLSVYKTLNEMCFGTDSVLCCWEGKGEVRERGGGGGGNCHIKGKEFKINLISQSLSPPKRFTVSMLCLVMRHKESTERVKWRRGERGRGSDRGNWLASDQVELVWEGSHRRGNFVCKSCVAISKLLCLYVWSSTNDLCCQSHICIYTSLPVPFPQCLTL